MADKVEHRIGIFLPCGFIEMAATAWPIVNNALCIFRGDQQIAQFSGFLGWADFGEVKPDERPRATVTPLTVLPGGAPPLPVQPEPAS